MLVSKKGYRINSLNQTYSFCVDVEVSSVILDWLKDSDHLIILHHQFANVCVLLASGNVAFHLVFAAKNYVVFLTGDRMKGCNWNLCIPGDIRVEIWTLFFLADTQKLLFLLCMDFIWKESWIARILALTSYRESVEAKVSLKSRTL